MEPELVRYLEHLQTNMATGQAQHTRDPAAFLDWLRENRTRFIAFSAAARDAELMDELERQLSAYTPATRFDSPSSALIFEPILSQVLKAAKMKARKPNRKIIFANSTDVSPSPLSVPSEGDHLIFFGAGTFAFCNYWAKLVTWLVLIHQSISGVIPMSSDSVQQVWERAPEFKKAVAHFIAYCRAEGTAVGYGTMQAPQPLGEFRMELLDAMEYFAVAHEVGHCYELEQGRVGTKDEELRCDLYALDICREAGRENQNWSTHCGAGALLLLAAANICRDIPVSIGSKSHPDLSARRDQIMKAAAYSTMKSSMDSWHYLLDFLVISQELASVASDGTGSA